MGGIAYAASPIQAPPPTSSAPTAVAPPAPGTSGGGPTPPDSSISSALTQLQAATNQLSMAVTLLSLQQTVNQLSAVVSSIAGAAQVQGGGPTQSPVQVGADAAPSAYIGATSTTSEPAKPATSDAHSKKKAKAKSKANSSTRQRIVDIARSELKKGVREHGGANNGDDIKRYRRAVTGPGEDPNAAEPWCADFASYVWKTAGVPFGKDGRGSDYTVEMVQRARRNGTWKSKDPQPGDLVMIDWGGGRGAVDPSSPVDHVAVVVKVENGKVYTIGGNESDKVKSSSYQLDDKRMLGFIKPAGG